MRRALLAMALVACGGPVLPPEGATACDGTVRGTEVHHWIFNEDGIMHTVCAADGDTGVVTYPLEHEHASTALCAAGPWVFEFSGETGESIATQVGQPLRGAALPCFRSL